MLPIDVTFDTGEETERGPKRKKKNIVKNNNCSKVRYNRGTVDKSREYLISRDRFLLLLL